MEAEFDALVLGIQDALLLRSLLWMLFSGFDVPVEHTGVRSNLLVQFAYLNGIRTSQLIGK